MVKRQLRKIIVLLTRKFLNYVRKEINPLSRFELCKNNITCTKLIPKKKKNVSLLILIEKIFHFAMIYIFILWQYVYASVE